MKYLFEDTKNIVIIIILFLPSALSAQFSESLLNKIRFASEDYYISHDTLNITGSRTLPCLDVKINNHGPYRFLIDLGSNVINFKESVVEEANINLIVDRDRGDIAKANKLEIGSSVFLDVYGAVYEDLDVDGVIGFNLLGKENFMMDYPNMKFAFVSDVTNPMDSTYIKYEEFGRMPYLITQIGNKKILLNFDTGASGWLYFPLFMKDSVNLKSPITNSNKVWNNQNGVTQSSYVQIKDSVSFGNFVITEPAVVFLPDIEDVFIGSSLLMDFKLTFYTSQKLVKMDRDSKNKVITIPEKKTP